MLDIKKVLAAKPREHEEAELMRLITPWGEALDAAHVLEEHPTPQFARAAYKTLNGVWTCAFVQSGHAPDGDLESVCGHAEIPAPDAFSRQILVPFSPETPLSGVNRQLQPDELLWYRRTFEPGDLLEGERCIIHFQAVDFACSVHVNGRLVATHAGAYTPFSLDATDFLVSGENELAVCVADPSEFGFHLRGKQRFDRGDIWYTAQSGIWQSVWMEIIPALHIDSIVLEPELETGILTVGVRLNGLDGSEEVEPLLEMRVLDGSGREVAGATCVACESTCALAAHVPNPRAWSPRDPYLYTIELQLGADRVSSYCGFRSVEVKEDGDGRKHVFLNGKPIFIRGILDQGYWSDGLMTAPSDEALVFDIESVREAGFNLMRKHIKIEAERWYYHCDRLGMLVLQDMVSGGDAEIKTWQWSHKPTLFKASWRRYRDDRPGHWEKLGAGSASYREEWTATCAETVGLLGNHPCVIAWSLFNEGWGQFNARDALAMVRGLDPTRPVDAVSGWYDQRCGDFYSVHNYFRELDVWRDAGLERAFLISEFGGITFYVDGHSAQKSAYGYELYENLPAWQEAFRELLGHANALEEKGLAGYVYTQVSDVEEETNGILTFDRRVNKLALS